MTNETDEHWLLDIWRNEWRGLLLGILIGPGLFLGVFALLFHFVGVPKP